MKQITRLNTLFGALVGSLPILVGMSAIQPIAMMNGNNILVFSYLFLW